MSDTTNNTEVVETEVEQNNKTEKKFQSTMKRLVAIVGGEQNVSLPKKTPRNEIGNLISELFKEERETILTDTKNSLKSLLKQHAEMEKAFTLKRKELDSLYKQKKEEFNKAAETVFNKIDGIADQEKEYYNGLKEATTSK